MPTDLPNERALRKPGTLELDPAGEGIAIDESPRLIASNKVEGTAVYDSSKVSGQVAYVVLAFGGFLGLGETHHPLPWKALTYSTEFGGYVIDIDPAVLAGASSSGAGEDEVADPSYRARI